MVSKQFRLAAFFTLVGAMLLTIWIIFSLITRNDWKDLIELIFTALLLYGSSMISFSKAKSTIDNDNTTNLKIIEPYQRFIIHPEVHIFEQLLLYNVNGQVVGRYEPGNSILKYLEVIIRNLPFEHHLMSEHGRVLTLDIKGIFNQTIVVRDANGIEVGTIKQKFLSSLFRFNVEVAVDGETYHLKSDRFFGELHEKDLLEISSFKVPIQISEKFKRISNRLYICEHDLTTNKGKVALAVLLLYATIAREK